MAKKAPTRTNGSQQYRRGIIGEAGLPAAEGETPEAVADLQALDTDVSLNEGIVDAADDTGTELDEPGEPDAPEGLHWVINNDPRNPFASQLLVVEEGETILAWDMDPLTINELLITLAEVKAAQIAVLTGTPVSPAAAVLPTVTTAVMPATVTQEPSEATNWEPNTEPGLSIEDAPRSWWARHKFFTALMIFILVVLLVPALYGSLQI